MITGVIRWQRTTAPPRVFLAYCENHQWWLLENNEKIKTWKCPICKRELEVKEMLIAVP